MGRSRKSEHRASCKGTRTVGVQADCHGDQRLRACRRLEEGHRHYGAVRLLPGPHAADLNTPKDHTTRVDLRQQRRLCDCVKCIEHGLRLAADQYSAEVPAAQGIRYVTLPGIPTRPSTKYNRDRLAQLINAAPKLRSWYAAVRVAPHITTFYASTASLRRRRVSRFSHP